MNTTLNPSARRLIEEAVEWRLIGLLLERPTEQWREGLPYVAHEAGDEELRAAAQVAVHDASEGEYLRAFGPGGRVSPREIAHTQTRDPGHVLAQLGAMYEAFAYRPHTEETPDHVSVETGFVAYLRLKQAFAVACDNDEHARTAADAAAAFVERHLSTFVEPLTQRVSDDEGHYMASALRALLRRTGPRRHDREGGWTPDGLDAACLTCPGCE